MSHAAVGRRVRRRIGAGCTLAIAFVALVALGAPALVPAAVLAQAGTVEIALTPGDAIDQRIIAAIDRARARVHVLAYSFTHSGIAHALIAARRRGVDVQVVVDRGQALTLPHTVVPELRRGGVPVWLDPGPGAAHNKVVIVDSGTPAATIVTGSFNFTRAAQIHNAENVVIFHRNPDVAGVYERYFERRRAHARRWKDVGATSRPHPHVEAHGGVAVARPGTHASP